MRGSGGLAASMASGRVEVRSKCRVATLSLLFLLCLSGLTGMVAMAQGSTSSFTGAINGLVTDEADGSPIPGAVVRIVSVNTGREWTAQTSSAGTFVFDLIAREHLA